MRKSTIFILLLIGTLFVLSPAKSSRDNSDHFSDWSPNSAGTGCHDEAVINTHAEGSIVFNTTWVVIEEGKDFVLSAEVVGFSGKIVFAATDEGSHNDVVIGFKFTDEDNSEFIATTMSKQQHTLDGSGNSVTPWVTSSFTAPSGPDATGNYTLIAYAVAGNNNNFDWIGGIVRVQVIAPIGPQGVEFTLGHEGVIENNIALRIGISNMTDVKTIEFSYDNGTYVSQLINPAGQKAQRYTLDVSEFAPGTHNLTVRITNQIDLITLDTIEFVIPEPVTTTPTTTSTTPTSTTPQETIVDTVDHGILSNPVILGVLVVVMIIAIAGPWILLRKS